MRIHGLFARLAFPLALSCAVPAFGAGLYSGEAPVNSQSEGERTEALKVALAQVIVKVSGDNAILTRPEIAKAIAGAERYVQQYQYSRSGAPDGQLQPHLSLIAQFNRDAIDQLIGGASGDATASADAKPQSYRVWVSGVTSADAYARLVGALSHNELVRGVQSEQAKNDGIELKIDAVGPLQRVLDSLGNGPLRVANAKPPIAGIDALLDLQP